ncbi:MAG: hypothetical protein AAF610_01460 [Pseudomonadota bacterium]
MVETSCQACGQERPWHLHTVTMWLSLFLVRVLPTGNEFWLRCAGCGDGFQLGNERNAVIRRGDPADDPAVISWIRMHQGVSGNP